MLKNVISLKLFFALIVSAASIPAVIAQELEQPSVELERSIIDGFPRLHEQFSERCEAEASHSDSKAITNYCTCQTAIAIIHTAPSMGVTNESGKDLFFFNFQLFEEEMEAAAEVCRDLLPAEAQ